MSYLKLAWRNIGRNLRRSILSITAIAIASLAIVFLFSLIAGMKGDMADNLITYYTGEVRIRNAQYNLFEHLHPTHLTVSDVDRVLATLDDMEEVDAVVPRITTGGAVFRDQRRIPLVITGVDFERERTYSGIRSRIVAGSFPEPGGAGSPAAASEPSPSSGRASGPRIVPAIVGTGVLDRLDLKVGDQFTVLTRTAQRGSNAMTFSIAAVANFPVASLNDAGFWAPFSDVQRLMRMENETSEVLVKLSPATSPDVAVSAISTALTSKISGLDVEYWRDIDTSYSFIVMAETIYNFVALFFFVLAGTVIANTTMMTIFERRKEIGTLGAMGMLPGAASPPVLHRSGDPCRHRCLCRGVGWHRCHRDRDAHRPRLHRSNARASTLRFRASSIHASICVPPCWCSFSPRRWGLSRRFSPRCGSPA